MPQTISPHLFVETVNGVTVLTIADAELIADDVIEGLKERLDLVEGPGLSRVIVNFREVRLMSSSVLAVLLRFSKKVAAYGGSVRLCCLTPDLFTVFRITRFDRLFPVYSEESAALDSFA